MAIVNQATFCGIPSVSARRAEMLRTLQGLPADVSVLDLHALAACVLSALTRKHRAIALERLYEFLDRYQPNIDKVNRYVQMLDQRGLTQGS